MTGSLANMKEKGKESQQTGQRLKVAWLVMVPHSSAQVKKRHCGKIGTRIAGRQTHRQAGITKTETCLHGCCSLCAPADDLTRHHR